MKKKLFKLFVLAVALTGMTSTYAGDYLLGYSKAASSRNVGEGEDKVPHKLSAAIELDKEKMAVIKDGKLSGVAFALSAGTKGVQVETYKNLSVWVRRTLDGPNIAEKKVADKDIALGIWSHFAFDTPLSIENEEILYVGYTITANSLIIACDGVKNPDERSCWYGADDNPWITYTEVGHFAVRAAFTGDNVPQVDADMFDVVSPKMVKAVEGQFGVTAYIYNWASEINSADLVCKVNGKEVSRVSGTDLKIPFASYGTIFFDGFTCPETGNLNVQYELTNINGGTDFDMSYNTVDALLLSTPDCTPRKILMEHFTTLQCPSCPEGLAALTEGVTGFEDRVAWVAHHVGYGTDKYTLSESNNFLNFFNASPYAPAVMLDRVNWKDMGALTTSTDQMTQQQSLIPAQGPAFFPSPSPSLISLILANRLSEYSPVKISIRQEYSEWPNLNITVRSEALQPLKGTPAVSLFLIQNELPGSASHGIQDHVIRHIANASPYYGDAIEFDENGVNETTFTVSIKDKWWVPRMKVVAMVGNINDVKKFDVNDAEIYNAEIVDVLGHPEGIEANQAENNLLVYGNNGMVVVEGEYTSMQVYTVDGKAVSNSNLSGVYVVKVISNDEVITRKVRL